MDSSLYFFTSTHAHTHTQNTCASPHKHHPRTIGNHFTPSETDGATDKKKCPRIISSPHARRRCRHFHSRTLAKKMFNAVQYICSQTPNTFVYENTRARKNRVLSEWARNYNLGIYIDSWNNPMGRRRRREHRANVKGGRYFHVLWIIFCAYKNNIKKFIFYNNTFDMSIVFCWLFLCNNKHNTCEQRAAYILELIKKRPTNPDRKHTALFLNAKAICKWGSLYAVSAHLFAICFGSQVPRLRRSTPRKSRCPRGWLFYSALNR